MPLRDPLEENDDEVMSRRNATLSCSSREYVFTSSCEMGRDGAGRGGAGEVRQSPARRSKWVRVVQCSAGRGGGGGGNGRGGGGKEQGTIGGDTESWRLAAGAGGTRPELTAYWTGTRGD